MGETRGFVWRGVAMAALQIWPKYPVSLFETLGNQQSAMLNISHQQNTDHLDYFRSSLCMTVVLSILLLFPFKGGSMFPRRDHYKIKR